MDTPENDTNDRSEIWDSMQDLYMDTDTTDSYEGIAKVCGRSKYSIEELEDILFNEVLPAVRFNLFCLPIPEWAGFNKEWLIQRVLKKHRFGKSRPWILRSYTKRHWINLVPLIHAEKLKNA